MAETPQQIKEKWGKVKSTLPQYSDQQRVENEIKTNLDLYDLIKTQGYAPEKQDWMISQVDEEMNRLKSTHPDIFNRLYTAAPKQDFERTINVLIQSFPEPLLRDQPGEPGETTETIMDWAQQNWDRLNIGEVLYAQGVDPEEIQPLAPPMISKPPSLRELEQVAPPEFFEPFAPEPSEFPMRTQIQTNTGEIADVEIREDFSVWQENERIGTINPATGEITPWIVTATLPTGEVIGTPPEIKTIPLLTEGKHEITMRAVREGEEFATIPEEKLREILIAEAKTRRATGDETPLELGLRLQEEEKQATDWVMSIPLIFIPGSATGAWGKLAPWIARGGAKKFIAWATRAGLSPFVAMEKAPGAVWKLVKATKVKPPEVPVAQPPEVLVGKPPVTEPPPLRARIPTEPEEAGKVIAGMAKREAIPVGKEPISLTEIMEGLHKNIVRTRSSAESTPEEIMEFAQGVRGLAARADMPNPLQAVEKTIADFKARTIDKGQLLVAADTQLSKMHKVLAEAIAPKVAEKITPQRAIKELQALRGAKPPEVPVERPPVTEVPKPPVTPPGTKTSMPTIEELIEANRTPNVARRIGQKLAEAPIIGTILKRIPALTAKTDVERAIIAWKTQREMASSLASIEMDAVYAEKSAFKLRTIFRREKPWQVETEGIVTNATSKDPKKYPLLIQTILEFPDRYVLTATQRKEVDLLDNILRAQLEKELAAGIKVPITPLKLGQRYFPRFIKEVRDLETQAITEIKRGVSTRPGAQPGSFKARYYEEVLDGIIKGKRYSVDYRAAVEMRLRAGNRAIVDKMLADYLKPLGRLPKDAIQLQLRLGMEEIQGKRAALKQISELIEHINAKRDLDWFRWVGIKKWYPEQYTQLRAITKQGKNVPAELKRFIVDAKKNLTQSAKDIKLEYSQELKRARRPILGKEGIINHAALQGRLFPIDIADATNPLLRGEINGNQLLATFSKLNAVARLGQTAIDLGWGMIQLSMTAFNHPMIWAKAMGRGVGTLLNPRYVSKWATISEHATTKRLIANHGGAEFGSLEFTEAARTGGWLSKIPAVGKIFRRFGRAMEDGLDTARIMIVESKIPHYTRKLGRELTDAELTDIIVTTDHMVGISSLQRLGISQFDQQLATNVLYAPRYFIAFVSFIGRAFQGGIGGDIARQSIGKFLIGSATFMSALAVALGQKERITPTAEKPVPVMFDPTSGEFMTVEIAGTHMGLGGIWIAGFRLLGSIMKASTDDPNAFLSIDPHENPLLRYGYGRASPILSGAIDVISGKNYLGERLDTPQDYLEEVIDKTFPFWAAGAITDVPKTGWQKGLAEWWGLRAWMVQYRELAQKYAEEHIKDIPDNMIMPWQKEKGIETFKYEDLNNEQRAWLLLTYEDFREAEEKRLEQRLEKGTNFQVADIRTRELLDVAYQADLEELAQGVKDGITTVVQYQEQAEYLRRIRQGEYQYRAIAQQFLDTERWADLQKWIEENQKPEDRAYDNYMELRGNPPKVGGVPDWEAWENNINSYLNGLDNATRTYIERKQDDWVNKLSPTAQQIEKLILECEKVLDEYYAVPEGKARLDYRDAHPDIDAKLVILRGLKSRPNTGTRAGNLLRQYGLDKWAEQLEVIPPSETNLTERVLDLIKK